jgi:ribosomal protein S18 acetylase RimI-like enzyme
MNISTYQPGDEAAVVRLWNECGLVRPWNDPHKDIARKLARQPELFLVGKQGAEVIATAMAGYDGHRGWVYYVAVAPDCRKKSYGRQLMREVERRLIDLGCPKINLQVRTSNRATIDFYRSLGYVRDEAVSLGRRLIPDD